MIQLPPPASTHPMAIDATLLQMHAAAHSLIGYVGSETADEIIAGLPTSARKPGNVWDPESAGPVLQEIHDHLDLMAKKLAPSLAALVARGLNLAPSLQAVIM